MKKSISEQFELISPKYRWKLPRMLVFLMNSFKADAYVFNWIEDSAVDRGGMLGALMSILGLYIVRWRKAGCVWIFHNIHSHGGETKWNRYIRGYLFKHANLIIAHSQEAADYASQFASCTVVFKNHPVERVKYDEWKGNLKECDFFIGVPSYRIKGWWNFSQILNARNQERKHC